MGGNSKSLVTNAIHQWFPNILGLLLIQILNSNRKIKTSLISYSEMNSSDSDSDDRSRSRSPHGVRHRRIQHVELMMVPEEPSRLRNSCRLRPHPLFRPLFRHLQCNTTFNVGGNLLAMESTSETILVPTFTGDTSTTDSSFMGLVWTDLAWTDLTWMHLVWTHLAWTHLAWTHLVSMDWCQRTWHEWSRSWTWREGLQSARALNHFIFKLNF